MLLIPNGEKILINVSVVVWGQGKSENSSLPVAVRVSKMRVLKLPKQLFTEVEVNSTWLITSELANQRVRKEPFTCVVYANSILVSPN